VQEDLWLLEMQKKLGGNKWSEISRESGVRSDIQIKNRFNCLVRREEDLLKRTVGRIDGYQVHEIADLLIEKLKKQVRDVTGR